MVLKKKLSLGLGFLFFIIFVLAIFCSFYVQMISRDSDAVLKNNYDSIVFSKKMFLAADDMKTAAQWILFSRNKGHDASNYYIKLFDSGKREFEINKNAEAGNITEIHENEYVNTLNESYDIFLNLCLQIRNGRGSNIIYFNEMLPAYEKMRNAIVDINNVNMQAIVRKNQVTKKDSESILISMGIIGTICIMLAFVYFWYFPFYISNSISYVSKRMKDILNNAGIKLDHEPDDELYLMLHYINLLENKFNAQGKRKK